MLNKCISFFKKETVFIIATLLAIISMFFVKPNIGYFDYINWKTLITLFLLMLVVQFLSSLGVFDFVIRKLLKVTKNTRQLVLVLVLVCFFFSFLITNDVALVTFVPFAMLTLRRVGQERLMIPTIILQTLAANLGSMFTPIGNPQNLYLYALSKCSLIEFLKLMLPYTLVSLVMIIVSSIVLKSEKIEMNEVTVVKGKTGNIIVDTFKGIDYFLLLTFASFFILIGNLQNISAIQHFFESTINGHEMIIGVLASQIISNVPAAILLSGFSNNLSELIVGVNLGGLGTLIASMASIISYKIYAHNYNDTKGKYLLYFSGANIVYLLVLIGLYYIV